MREIKFRLWDKADGLHRDIGSMSYFTGYLPENDANSVMQFTGLRDKNGNEIYEGDILVFEDPDNQDGELVKKIDGKGFVQWDDSCHLYRYFVRALFVHCGARPGVSLGDFGDLENIEIIGNIYENPELVK